MLFNNHRSIIVDEENVTKVLTVVNAQLSIGTALMVKNCAWADEPNKWFVAFDASNSRWTKIVDQLKTIGKVTVKKDLYFEIEET